MDNPFVFGKPVSGENFADREREIKELALDLRSGQNVLVYSPRRFGKTSLLSEVLAALRKEGILTVYADLFLATSKNKFADIYASALASGTETKVEAMVRTLRDLLGVAPKFTLKSDTLPVEVIIELELRRTDVGRVLEKLYDAPQRIAKKKGKRVVVVFDEFQEIAKMDGEEIERSMRTKIQHHDKVAYVFMGSRKHLLAQIFGSRARPFYKSAKEYPLGGIPPDQFGEFIHDKFRKSGFRVEAAAIARIIEVAGGHPYYVQQLCHELWNRNLAKKEVGTGDIDAALEAVLSLNSMGYVQIWDSLPAQQKAVLLAVAADGDQVYSAEFIERRGLISAAHVQRALKSLEQKEIIEKNTHWAIGDVFFKEWLKRQG